MKEDEDRTIFWLDYIIASDDPADQALITEYNTQTWTHGQTMQAVQRSGEIIQASLDLIGQQMDAAHELQKRIHARALELQAAGHQPATGEQITAWRAAWLRLAQNVATDDDPIYRT